VGIELMGIFVEGDEREGLLSREEVLDEVFFGGLHWLELCSREDGESVFFFFWDIISTSICFARTLRQTVDSSLLKYPVSFLDGAAVRCYFLCFNLPFFLTCAWSFTWILGACPLVFLFFGSSNERHGGAKMQFITDQNQK